MQPIVTSSPDRYHSESDTVCAHLDISKHNIYIYIYVYIYTLEYIREIQSQTILQFISEHSVSTDMMIYSAIQYIPKFNRT